MQRSSSSNRRSRDGLATVSAHSLPGGRAVVALEGVSTISRQAAHTQGSCRRSGQKRSSSSIWTGCHVRCPTSHHHLGLTLGAWSGHDSERAYRLPLQSPDDTSYVYRALSVLWHARPLAGSTVPSRLHSSEPASRTPERLWPGSRFVAKAVGSDGCAARRDRPGPCGRRPDRTSVRPASMLGGAAVGSLVNARGSMRGRGGATSRR